MEEKYDGKNNLKDNDTFYGQNSDGSYWLSDGTKDYILREKQERKKFGELTEKIQSKMDEPVTVTEVISLLKLLGL